jgi:hypothetical protein
MIISWNEQPTNEQPTLQPTPPWHNLGVGTRAIRETAKDWDVAGMHREIPVKNSPIPTDRNDGGVE